MDVEFSNYIQKTKTWFKHHWKKIFSSLGAIFMVALGLVGGLVDTPELWKKLFPTPIPELTYTSDGEVNPGDSITITYKAANNGYLSLWNQSSTGVAEKKLPITGMGTLKLNANIASSSIGFTARNETGTDRFILIWTDKGTPQHLPRNQYSTPGEFTAALKALDNRADIQKAEIEIPVYPTR